MNKNYQLLSRINLDMFYAIRITPYEITLQGNQSSDTIISVRLNYMKSYEDFYIDDDGCVVGEFTQEGVKVRIVLI